MTQSGKWCGAPADPQAARARPCIAIANLSKAYPNDKEVIRDLSVSAMAGEFVSLLGASGCGKSTLLRMIAGLSPISGGAIHIDGMIPKDAIKLMSFVFQDPALLPWRSVARNVELALEFEGVPVALRPSRIATVLNLVGLRDVDAYYPRELSGGMRMRVSLARALVTTPRILLMDEPFSALDEMSRNRLNEELLALQEQHRWTTLFVTHSIAEAVFLSNRIVLMGANPGRIVQEIDIPLGARRNATLRSEPAFLSLVGRVSEALAAISP